MSVVSENVWSTDNLTRSNIRLTEPASKSNGLKEKGKWVIKSIKYVLREITVEPCLFIYMICIAISSLAVQNMHLEKSCRVNFQYGEEVCDRIRDRNTTGLEQELKNIQTLVAQVTAWKFPLMTGIPAVMLLFVGAWSDRTKKRKICILFPMIGEIISNIGLLLATYFLNEWSLESTVLIEALPPAFTGCYIIIFMGMYTFMTDRTTFEDRTFRIGLVTIFVTLGTPTGTALSGILLRVVGYYGVFSILLVLHSISFIYGFFRLEDVVQSENLNNNGISEELIVKSCNMFKEVTMPVIDTFKVAFKSRPQFGRIQIISLLILYFLMVGPLYGDSQLAYLYAIQKFSLTEVEFSVYGTINVVLGLFGTIFCISILSKWLKIEDTAIGSLAGVSRIASCFILAFAPTRLWFYSAPIVNIFSHTGLTAVRSITTKVVPVDEVAKLSSLLGLAEALAPSVYMPASNNIYVLTIDTFPGAFYMFDAALTVFAVILFGFLYFLKRRIAMPYTESKNVISEKDKVEVSRI